MAGIDRWPHYTVTTIDRFHCMYVHCGEFLGACCVSSGTATDPTKVESVRNWPTPYVMQGKEVQQFLG